MFHLAYADDITIFCNGSKLSLRKHIAFFDQIYKFTGLKVNNFKSCFAIGKPDCPKDVVIRAIIGFKKQDLPMVYLGCPLYIRRNSKTMFYPLLTKIQEKLSGWKSKLLSHGAKLVLIKHVLLGIHLYLIPLIQAPKLIFNAMNKISSNFFWHDTSGTQKLTWLLGPRLVFHMKMEA